MGCIFDMPLLRSNEVWVVSKAFTLSSLGHGVAQAELALGIKTLEAKSELLRSNVLIPSLCYTMSLATSGCSIVVVYAVWDRVVRVRFPAPRQNVQWTFCR